MGADTHGAHRGGYWIYLRTWFWLLVITVGEVGIVLLRVPTVVLVVGLITLALLKAALIIAIFMHMRLERLNFVYAVLVPMVLIAVLFFGIVPDAFGLRERAVQVPSLQEMERAAQQVRPREEQQGRPPAATLDMTEFRFTPNQFTVKAGQTTFRLVNVGAIPHSFVITDLGDIGIEPINAGTSTTFTGTIPAGTHRFICDVPGHAEAGMVGSFVAQP